MKNKIKAFLFMILGIASGVANAAGPPLEVSEAKDLGDGQVRAYGFVAGGRPIGMGFTFDGSVFDNAPMEASDGKWDVLNSDGEVVWRCCGHELDFDAPDNIAAVTNFKHFVMNWNPHGHPPPHVYTVPHFDFHFYTQSRSDRTSITAPTEVEMCNGGYGIPVVPLNCVQLDKAMEPLPADQQPPNHTTVGAVEPAMGNHMVDLSSPEFSGSEFTHTFIFGTWEGDLTFWEPMISVNFLNSVRHSCFDIANPAAAPDAGWYPTEYCISHNRKHDTFDVNMRKFKWLPASGD